jgi:hypothetical protein
VWRAIARSPRARASSSPVSSSRRSCCRSELGSGGERPLPVAEIVSELRVRARPITTCGLRAFSVGCALRWACARSRRWARRLRLLSRWSPSRTPLCSTASMARGAIRADGGTPSDFGTGRPISGEAPSDSGTGRPISGVAPSDSGTGRPISGVAPSDSGTGCPISRGTRFPTAPGYVESFTSCQPRGRCARQLEPGEERVGVALA